MQLAYAELNNESLYKLLSQYHYFLQLQVMKELDINATD